MTTSLRSTPDPRRPRARFGGAWAVMIAFCGVAAGLAPACSTSETGLPTVDGAAGAGGAGGGTGGTGGMLDGAAGSGGGGAGGGGGGGVDAPMMDMRREGPPVPDALPDFTVVDAPPPSPGKIDCGDMSCDPDKQICCTTLFGGSAVEACLPKGSPCPGVTKTCDGREDCEGDDLCCFKLPTGGGGPGMLPEAQCTMPSNCTGGMGSSGGYPLCHTEADCPRDRPFCCAVSIYGATIPVCSALKC